MFSTYKHYNYGNQLKIVKKLRDNEIIEMVYI